MNKNWCLGACPLEGSRQLNSPDDLQIGTAEASICDVMWTAAGPLRTYNHHHRRGERPPLLHLVLQALFFVLAGAGQGSR